MAGFIGADVDELRAFAKLVDSAGRQLADSTNGLTATLAATRWLGPDAADFTARWNSQYRPGLTRASGSMQGIVAVIIENADQQHATSSDTGGAAGSRAGSHGSTTGSHDGMADRSAGELDDMSVEELRELAAKYSTDPAAAHDWWTSLTDEQRARLIEHAPELVGGLDGVPPLDRVAANANIAGDRIAANDDRIAELRDRIDALEANPAGTGIIESTAIRDSLRSELRSLETENGYLQKAVDGDIQLYTYDREADRLVEMIGNPETATQQLTWIPGTATDLASFYGSEKGGYGDGIQGLPASVAAKVPDTVVFVMKDGYYPQWDITHPPSDTSIALDLGKTQAQFQTGLEASGFASMPNTAVGHSAGLAILTASEQAGAHYDGVVSLSGIGMDGGWEPQAGTKYYDYTTDGDAILAARGVHASIPTVSLGGSLFDPQINVTVENMGFPLTPSAENGFTVLDSGIGLTKPAPFDPFAIPNLIKESGENHSLIASTKTSTEVRDGLIDVLSGQKPAGS